MSFARTTNFFLPMQRYVAGNLQSALNEGNSRAPLPSSHTLALIVSRCLYNLDNVSETVKSLREEILKADYDALLKSQSQHLSTKFVAEVARSS